MTTCSGHMTSLRGSVHPALLNVSYLSARNSRSGWSSTCLGTTPQFRSPPHWGRGQDEGASLTPVIPSELARHPERSEGSQTRRARALSIPSRPHRGSAQGDGVLVYGWLVIAMIVICPFVGP